MLMPGGRDYYFSMSLELQAQEAAFAALFEKNHARVHGLLTRIAGPNEADDLCQTAFVKAAQAWPTFRGEADAASWLHRIAVNTALDWMRSRQAHEAQLTLPLPEDSDQPLVPASAALSAAPTSPEQEVAEKDTHRCIREELAKLPDPYREVLTLRFLGELSEQEIADAVGISLGNVKVRLHRAKQEFREIVAARCDFYANELSCKPSSPQCCPASPDAGVGRTAV